MDIKKEKQKIEKALRVIELIETCNWQIEKHLEYYDDFLNLQAHYNKRITIMQGVKARLENYYKNLIK
jgi:hypothetical protein